MPTMTVDDLEAFLAARSAPKDYKGPMPNTTAGLPGLAVKMDPSLLGTGTMGYIKSSNVIAKQKENQARPQTVFVNPEDPNQKDTVGHEIEHLLSRQNTGFSQTTRDTFQDLLGPKPFRDTQQFLDGLKESLPYLKEKYGVEDAYMTPEFLDKQGRVGLYEILATLGGVESSQGVDLTKDPVLRKTMFKHRNVREAYNAVTGLRQTRLDPRDIPPYTVQPEKAEPGVMGKLKNMMGYANGGFVVKPVAGGKKDI